jgi:hypothetical protein
LPSCVADSSRSPGMVGIWMCRRCKQWRSQEFDTGGQPLTINRLL